MGADGGSASGATGGSGVSILARRNADRALAVSREQPGSLGLVLLAVRALHRVEGAPDLAHHLRRFVSAWGGTGPRASEVLLEAATRGTPLAFARDEVVYREGEAASSLFVVAEGTCEVERRGLGKVAQLQRGDFFGEGGLVARTRRLATVRAGRGAVLVPLNLQQADRLVRHLPGVGDWLRALHRERLASQVLPQRSPLGQLDADRREVLLDSLARRRVPTDTQLVTQHQVAGIFGIVLSGVADVLREAPGGPPQTIDRLVPGDLFGARSLLAGAPSTVTVETRGPVDFVALSAPRFLELMAEWPDVRRRLEVFVHARWGFAGGGPRRHSQVERRPLDPADVERVALGSTVPEEAPGPEADADDLAQLLGTDTAALADEAELLSGEMGGPAGAQGAAALAVMTCPYCRYRQVEADRCQNCGALMPWAPLPP